MLTLLVTHATQLCIPECRGGTDKSPAAVAAVMSSIYATLTRLARTLLGADSEDAADQLAGEYIRYGNLGMLLDSTCAHADDLGYAPDGSSGHSIALHI